jgi:hypothetical protein
VNDCGIDACGHGGGVGARDHLQVLLVLMLLPLLHELFVLHPLLGGHGPVIRPAAAYPATARATRRAWWPTWLPHCIYFFCLKSCLSFLNELKVSAIKILFFLIY